MAGDDGRLRRPRPAGHRHRVGHVGRAWSPRRGHRASPAGGGAGMGAHGRPRPARDHRHRSRAGRGGALRGVRVPPHGPDAAAGARARDHRALHGAPLPPRPAAGDRAAAAPALRGGRPRRPAGDPVARGRDSLSALGTARRARRTPVARPEDRRHRHRPRRPHARDREQGDRRDARRRERVVGQPRAPLRGDRLPPAPRPPWPGLHDRGVPRRCSRIGFTCFGMRRIVGRIEARNAASGRVLERLGMRREAHLVENEYIRGEWQSESTYALLAAEWRVGVRASPACGSRPPWRPAGPPSGR